MSSPIVEVIDVHAAYGRIDVLHGVNLVVPRGSVVALLGPNGAGKSTTLSVISGQLTPTSGCVHLAGSHVNGEATDGLARAGACLVPEGRSVFPNLTVTENLHLMTCAGSSFSEVKEIAFWQFPRLKQRRSQLAGTLSGGEQQMLAMARALSTRPALLMLDELSMGLAPLIVEELYEVVEQIAADGVSVLVVEQFARTALAVAEYAAVMQNGRIVAFGEPGDINEQLSNVYLGGAA